MENNNHFKSILVTGSAGCMGAACVRAFASAGYTVFAADIREAETGENIIPFVMDVTSAESVASAAAFVAERTGGLYAVVHLAGIYTMDPFSEIDEAQLARMLEVNLTGVTRVNRAFLPLVRRGGGRIVIVTSELAPLDPLPFNGVYTMTKTALDSYAHSLALELDLLGVPVVTVRPGAFGDGMPLEAVRSMERMERESALFRGVASRFKKIVISETGASRDPAIFARRMVKILQKRRPKFVYRINCSLKLILFSALPMRLQAFLLRLLLTGGKPKTED